ncbi:MAG: hypothetical protein CSA33_01230 [Desulfobulbus propionicus]|nr:MAG: hypothetical protein CSA33_01230 [Desulfobulbus propionicus]
MPYSQQQKLNVFERAEDTAEHRLHLKADEQTSYHSSSRRQRKLSLLANCFSDATPTLAGMEKGKRLINAVEHAQLDIDYDEKAAALDTSCRGDEVETRLQSAPFAKRKGLVFF